MNKKEQVAKLIKFYYGDGLSRYCPNPPTLSEPDRPFVCPNDCSICVADQIDALYKADITRLKEALTEISKGMGRYSQDPLTHASNTIDDMKRLALDTLLQQDKDCSGCEYKHVCKDGPQKPDYCPKGD
jgi:hypothetical protein